MKKLQQELEKYQNADISEQQYSKIKGEVKFGGKVSIKWKGRSFKDKGYLFSTPDNDDDLDMRDLFVHVPSPDNEDGIGDAPAEWCHINSLLLNDDCLAITCK